jgi:hypothetical protein
MPANLERHQQPGHGNAEADGGPHQSTPAIGVQQHSPGEQTESDDGEE